MFGISLGHPTNSASLERHSVMTLSAKKFFDLKFSMDQYPAAKAGRCSIGNTRGEYKKQSVLNVAPLSHRLRNPIMEQQPLLTHVQRQDSVAKYERFHAASSV
jgi:hypothetical protein